MLVLLGREGHHERLTLEALAEVHKGVWGTAGNGMVGHMLVLLRERGFMKG